MYKYATILIHKYANKFRNCIQDVYDKEEHVIVIRIPHTENSMNFYVRIWALLRRAKTIANIILMNHMRMHAGCGLTDWTRVGVGYGRHLKPPWAQI